MRSLSTVARSYILLMSAAAFLLAAGAFGSWRPENLTTLSFYIVGAVLAAHVSIPLPRVASTTSMSFVFVLTGIIEFGPAEAILIGWAGMLAETFRGPRSRWSVPKLPFNLASITLAAGAGHTAYHAAFVPAVLASLPIRLIPSSIPFRLPLSLLLPNGNRRGPSGVRDFSGLPRSIWQAQRWRRLSTPLICTSAVTPLCSRFRSFISYTALTLSL